MLQEAPQFHSHLLRPPRLTSLGPWAHSLTHARGPGDRCAGDAGHAAQPRALPAFPSVLGEGNRDTGVWVTYQGQPCCNCQPCRCDLCAPELSYPVFGRAHAMRPGGARGSEVAARGEVLEERCSGVWGVSFLRRAGNGTLSPGPAGAGLDAKAGGTPWTERRFLSDLTER